MARTFGNSGETFGVATRAYLDKKFLSYIVQQTMFDRLATLRRPLPKHNSKKIEFQRAIKMSYLYFDNNVNEKLLGNVIDPSTDGTQMLLTAPRGAYNAFMLPEGSSGDSKANMKRVKMEGEVFPIGDWDSYTEEVAIFDHMWSIEEEQKQMSELAAITIDTYYRDLYSNSAALDYDISANGVGNDSVADDAFTQACKRAGNALYLTGSRTTGHMIKASPEYGTVPVYTDYLAFAHPNMIEAIADSNPDFVPVEKYAPQMRDRLEDEMGKIGRIRLIREPNAFIDSTTTAGEYIGEVLVFGKDHTAHIPIRGKGAIQTIVHPPGSSGTNDQLNRVGTLGWKAWLGALTVYPERVAKITAKFKW